MTGRTSVGIVGAGIVGAALGRALAISRPDVEVTILEKEDSAARHQTGHNSGVVHAGLYYTPGSLKATLCQRGRHRLRDFCLERGLPYDEVGKVVVATGPDAEERLHAVREKAVANGVEGLELLDPVAALREREPHARGQKALLSPRTAITDYAQVTEAFLADVRSSGGDVLFGHEVVRVEQAGHRVRVAGSWGERTFDRLVSCGGLQSDRVARAAGVAPQVRIIPFRGRYYHLSDPTQVSLRGLVYPAPDPRYPFLGVHVTRHVDGNISLGPNAVLSLDREGYQRFSVDPGDTRDTLAWPGFWRMASRHWRVGLREMALTASKRMFLAAVEELFAGMSDLADDIVPIESGIRAQAIDRRGVLHDDFHVEQHGPLVLVLNAPSPAATSSMAIAEHLMERHLAA
ncbi:MAG: L-2-hydroxyglutarate oxidase [Propionibacteriales bacterium]|nr:L-2-hydroxyglutarate oxidase [Propionibacteriales bacterium]